MVTSNPTTMDSSQLSPPVPPDNTEGVNELSRLLLEGWTMLADVCPRPNCSMPLARSRDASRTVCTNCRLDVRTSTTPPEPIPNGTLTPLSASDPEPHSPSQPDPPSSVMTIARPRRDRDAASAAMGEKLLQGWTMLQNSCPHCPTPLLRNAAGKLLCVTCEPDGPQQTSPDQSQRAVARPDPSAIANRDTAVVANRDTAVIANHESAVVNGRDRTVLRAEHDMAAHERRQDARQSRPHPQMRPLQMTHEQTPLLPAAQMTEDALADAEIDVDNELRLAEKAAASTLKWLRHRLDNATELSSCTAICKAMTDAANTISAVRTARAKVC